MRGTLPIILGLALLAAACKGDSTFHDAAVGDDDPIDATTEPDAEVVETAMVTTFQHYCGLPVGARAGDIPIVVVAPDGTDSLFRTDVNGDATIPIVAGSSVTAIYPLSPCNEYNITTFAAVQAGDHLEFGTAYSVGGSTLTGAMDITWPAQTGLDSFEVINDCGISSVAGNATGGQIQQYDSCGTPTTDVLVIGYVAGTPTQWASIDDLTFVDTGSSAIASFQTPTTQPIEMTGIPATVAVADFTATPLVGSSQSAPSVNAYGAPTAGAISGAGLWTQGPDEVYLSLMFEGVTSGQQYVSDRVPHAATITIADPPLLPWIDAFDVDIATRAITWTQTATTGYDGAVAYLFWNEIPPALFGIGSPNYYWTFIMPPGVTSIEIPDLPAAFDAYEPDIADSVGGDIWLVDSAAATTSLRELPEWDGYCPDCRSLGDAVYPRVATSFIYVGGGKLQAPAPSVNRHRVDRRQLHPRR